MFVAEKAQNAQWHLNSISLFLAEFNANMELNSEASPYKRPTANIEPAKMFFLPHVCFTGFYKE